jgi:hypothetical protein
MLAFWETNPVLVVEVISLGVFTLGIVLYCCFFDKNDEDEDG